MKNSTKLLWRVTFVGLATFVMFILYITLRNTQIIDAIAATPFYRVFRVFFMIYTFGVAIFVVMDSKSASQSISWLIVMTVIPVLGVIVYLSFGRSFRKERIAKAKKKYSTQKLLAEMNKATKLFADVQPTTYAEKKLSTLLYNNGFAPLYYGNATFIARGQDIFEAMLKDIEQAKHHIHLEYYIVRDDQAGQRLKDALIKKARAGVEVRITYDGVGSWQLSDQFKDELIHNGVKIQPFLPVIMPIFNRELNYRNHRKITEIDGEIAYLGGMNIGDEYLSKSQRFGNWRDSQLRITGDAVNAVSNHFMIDWSFVSGQELERANYIKRRTEADKMLMQIVASGPDTDWGIMLQAYFTMITSAEKSVYITTPYLIPEDSILEALKTAALSGVDVRIIIPAKADHYLVYWGTRAYLQRLLKAGVKVYTYNQGFIHAKTIVIDERIASVGSANLDIRSLEINFEINAFVYNAQFASDVNKQFMLDIKDSDALSYAAYKARPFYHKIQETIGRLVSPLQ